MLLQMFRTLLADQIDISDEKIDELADALMGAIPTLKYRSYKKHYWLNIDNRITARY